MFPPCSRLPIKHCATPTSLALEVKGLSFGYPGHPLITDLSFSLSPGVTLLRGGDGRGKSTLLRLLAGVQPAQQGLLAIHGVGLQDQPQAYRQQLCWIDARSEDFDQITATAYFALRGKHAAFDGSALAELIDGLGLAPHLDKPLYMLSTGSKRKVWLAAAFASGAAVMLLDDPFAALDKASINFVLSRLQDAADHPTHACLLAHHEAPAGVRLAGLVDLGD